MECLQNNVRLNIMDDTMYIKCQKPQWCNECTPWSFNCVWNHYTRSVLINQPERKRLWKLNFFVHFLTKCPIINVVVSKWSKHPFNINMFNIINIQWLIKNLPDRGPNLRGGRNLLFGQFFLKVTWECTKKLGHIHCAPYIHQCAIFCYLFNVVVTVLNETCTARKDSFFCFSILDISLQ